jgi:hypothetical protein
MLRVPRAKARPSFSRARRSLDQFPQAAKGFDGSINGQF